MFWFLLGIVIGILIPAPYDAIARGWFDTAWTWVKSLFNGDKQE